jgi:hypothetical protein
VCGGNDVCTLPFSAGLQRLTQPIDYDIELTRTREACVVTNVPWTVIQHSPEGFEWGYAGSAPADLALNILNAFMPPGSDGQPPIKCWQGYCSYTAMVLHQHFKDAFIYSADRSGTTISANTIKNWLAANQPTYPTQVALL